MQNHLKRKLILWRKKVNYAFANRVCHIVSSKAKLQQESKPESKYDLWFILLVFKDYPARRKVFGRENGSC